MEECITEILEETFVETEFCSDDENGPYIEIELDTAHQNKGSTCIEGDVKLEQELRISISGSIPEAQKESVNVHSAAAESKIALSIPRGLWEIPQTNGHSQPTSLGISATRLIPYEDVDLYCKKQPISLTTTRTNGIMMKLLIKFRGTKIGALLASLKKPQQQQPCQVNNKRHKSTKKTKTFFKCYQKGTIVNPSNGKRSKQWNLEDDCMCGSFRNSKKSSKVMEMDMGAVKGIFSAMGMNIGQKSNRGSSKRGTRPTSCNTSPSYDEGISLCSSESSIKEAIAYCKSSLGQSSDLTFTSSISSSPSLFVA